MVLAQLLWMFGPQKVISNAEGTDRGKELCQRFLLMPSRQTNCILGKAHDLMNA